MTSPMVKVGGSLPAAKINLNGEIVNLREFFQHRTGVIFGLTGAFAPTCTKRHGPAIRDAADDIRRHVDFVGCILVNDPFVVKAWANKLNIGDQFTFISDSRGEFTRALGLGQNFKEYGFGFRSKRFAMVVGPLARIQWIGLKDEAQPSRVLKELPRVIRAPWKFFVVGIQNYRTLPKLHGCLEVLNQITAFATSEQNGFSEESDWQLCLSDTQQGNSFKPTADNIMNGLNWLVEGAQDGDSLFLYLCCHTVPCKEETLSVNYPAAIPIDYETSKPITAHFFSEILKDLPAMCRLTIIFDSHLSGPSISLPYVCYADSNHFEENPDVIWELGNREILMFGGCPTQHLTEEMYAKADLSPDEVGCIGSAIVSIMHKANHVSYKELLTYLQYYIGDKVRVALYASKPFDLSREFTVLEPIRSV